MQRCVIIGGAEIRNYDAVRRYTGKNDFCIFCDCGLRHAEPLGVKPDLIVGDFDSYARPETDIETIVLPCEKDDTDTVYAMCEALKRGYEDFLFLGVVGGRFDHTFGNISMLLRLHSLGKRAVIVDDYSEMEVFSGTIEIPDSYPFFSILNIDASPHGVTIKDAKYCLDNAEIGTEYQYGVSNEVLPGRIARVTLREGRMLLIRDRV